MAKPDGRVEAGQSLKRAISAQRWNDLCDAADIVHGRRGGVNGTGYKSLLYARVVPIRITTATEYPSAGVAVEYSDFEEYGGDFGQLTAWPREECHLGMRYITGTIPDATSLATQELETAAIPSAFAVTMEPKPQGVAVVPCAISGLCLAWVRQISTYHRFVSLPRNRGSGLNQSGLLETSDTGVAMFVTIKHTDENNIGLGLIKL